MKLDLVLLYVVCKDKEQAISFGKILVEEKLAACINIFDSITSIYPWENKIEIENESLMIVKTDKSKINSIESKILEIHTYKTPCIIQIKDLIANNSYSEWLKSNLET